VSEFKIDGAKIRKMSEEFKVGEDLILLLHKAYCRFSPSIQGRFLAHIMRGMESYIRTLTKNDRFIIICEPYKAGEFSQGQKQAISCYYPSRTTIRSNDKRNSSFIINYNSNLPEKELRDYIAHEIGHIFLAIMKKSRAGDWNSAGVPDTEPLSSIFGIFTMSEKNDFYANYDVSARNHASWQEMFDSFLKIHQGL